MNDGPIKYTHAGISPLEYRVLIEPLEVEEKTPGGLILPDLSKDKEQMRISRGRIMALSPQCFRRQDWHSSEHDLLPVGGELIQYKRHAFATVEGNDGNEYRMISDVDILCVIDETEGSVDG